MLNNKVVDAVNKSRDCSCCLIASAQFKGLVLGSFYRLWIGVPPKHTPKHQSSDVSALNYLPSPGDSAETLTACDPQEEESHFLDVQVDALVLQFLCYF